MAKEIFLFDSISQDTAKSFSRELTNAADENVTVQVLSQGGDVGAGYTMLAAMKKHGNVFLSAMGYADSMAAMMFCYAKDASCLDISRFMFHRAAYFFEQDMTEAERKELNRVNTYIRQGIESKVGSEKWEQVTGVSLDEMFSMDGRIDVLVDAEQALEMGLVSSIESVTNEVIQNIAASSPKMAIAMSMQKQLKAEKKPESKKENINSNNQIPKNMTVEEIQTKHPEAYKEILAQGIEQERDRVEAWVTFNDIDAEAVKAGIESGKGINQKATAEFMRKSLSAEQLKNIEADSNKSVETEEKKPEAKSEKEIKAEKETEDFLKQARGNYSHLKAQK